MSNVMSEHELKMYVSDLYYNLRDGNCGTREILSDLKNELLERNVTITEEITNALESLIDEAYETDPDDEEGVVEIRDRTAAYILEVAG